MRKILLTVVLLAAASGITAGVLDLQSRVTLKARLEQSNEKDAQTIRHIRAKAGMQGMASVMQETLAFVSLAPGATAADLEAAGMKVENICGGIAIVRLPVSEAERMASADAVSVMQLPREMRPHLDLARRATGVDVIHAGDDGLKKPYTGKGVFTGIVDQGLIRTISIFWIRMAKTVSSICRISS